MSEAVGDIAQPGTFCRKRRGVLSTDPRTKVFLLLLFAVATFLAPGIWYEVLIMTCAALFGFASGKRGYPVIMFIIYGVMLASMFAASMLETSVLKTMLMSFFMLLRKVFPCALLAGVVVSTTRIGEFMSAMGRLRISRSVVIPLAVMLRYVPVIREDWGFIKDAMRMRDVSPSVIGFLKNPSMTVECVYVPLMMSANNAADELTMASIARGIENPEPRTCFVPIAFGIGDVVVTVLALMVVVGAILL